MNEVALPELRHYSAIWRQVKNKTRCILQDISPDLLKRYKAAVGKEKLRDITWNKHFAARLVFTETSDRDGKYTLVITLNSYIANRNLRQWLKKIKHKEVIL